MCDEQTPLHLWTKAFIKLRVNMLGACSTVNGYGCAARLAVKPKVFARPR